MGEAATPFFCTETKSRARLQNLKLRFLRVPLYMTHKVIHAKGNCAGTDFNNLKTPILKKNLLLLSFFVIGLVFKIVFKNT